MHIQFQIEYYTQWGEELHVSISRPGHEVEELALSTHDGRVWTGVADWAEHVTDDIVYRYFVTRDGREFRREVGAMPHTLHPHRRQDEYTQHDWWQEPQRMAGVAVPVFSLRSQHSQGIGDFGDLRRLIDWAHSVGMRVVQLLPVNDTTSAHRWTDSYPYNVMSVNALHPIYIDLSQLPPLEKKTRMAEYQRTARRLNRLADVDYEAVEALKQAYLHALYRQEGERMLRSAPCRKFLKANAEWLRPYAAFSVLRDTFGTPDYTQWPLHSHYTADTVDAVCHQYPQETNYYCYVQYLLHTQLLAAAHRARQLGIVLKGDIPIGVSRRCVETWQNPHYFNLDCQTGAPPDFFSEDGQNWGFPTYNWSVMARDGYRWWRSRMQRMAQYFMAYRIDHILGFFRIWEIPHPHRTGLLGHFAPAMPMSREEIEGRGVPFVRDMYLQDLNNHSLYHPRISAKNEAPYAALDADSRRAFDALYEDFFYHRHNQFWYDEAMRKLPPIIHSTQMIACGEDLGMVPACVEWVMKELGILSLEIQSMPKAMWTEFGDPATYPTLSVCTISSHDTPSMRGWWQEDELRRQRYYNNAMGLQGTAPADMTAALCQRVVAEHLRCPSALCILTIQDWLATDETLRLPDPSKERINIPANPRHYWRFRLHISIEQLQAATEFNKNIRQLIETNR